MYDATAGASSNSCLETFNQWAIVSTLTLYASKVMSDSGFGELYDLETDPGEFENLWERPEHAGTRARLMERLVQLEIEHTDTVPYPTGRA